MQSLPGYLDFNTKPSQQAEHFCRRMYSSLSLAVELYHYDWAKQTLKQNMQIWLQLLVIAIIMAQQLQA